MNLDIKLPIGLMFLILGILVTVFGIASNGNTEMYEKSLGVNVNLWTGIFMLIFGSLMLAFARRPKKKV